MASVQAYRVLSDSPGIRFDFTWADVPRAGNAADSTRGHLALSAGDAEVWVSNSGFEWTWVELLEWLTRSWTRLTHEEGLPLDLEREPASSYALTSQIAGDAQLLPAPMAADLEMRFWEFAESHDLARALQGALPPTLLIWREGAIGHLLSSAGHEKCSWELLEGQLTQLGDAIATRLQGLDDERAEFALRGWASRGNRSADKVFRLSSGLRGSRAERAFDMARDLDLWSDQDLGAASANEFAAVARMTAGMTEEVMEQIVRHLAAIAPVDRTLIDAQSAAILHEVDLETGRPYEQGYEIAASIRAADGLSDNERFDAMGWLRARRIECSFVTIDSRAVDAFAAWGRHVGPAVFVNKKGDRSGSPSSRNASMAHEICHLLVDRARALPAAEVLGGRSNPIVEARANAMAAEVLLPRSTAGELLESADNVDQAKKAVRSLSATFVASREVVAWQALNSEYVLEGQVEQYLRSLTTRRVQV